MTDEQRDKVAENWPLVYWGVGKVRKNIAAVVGEEALYDIAVDALIHAVENHDPERGELTTLFGWRYFRRVCQFAERIVRRMPTRNIKPGSWDRFASDDESVADTVADAETYAAQLAAISTLSAEERDLLTRRYLDGESTSETCKRLGVSHQTIYNKVAKIRAKLNPAD